MLQSDAHTLRVFPPAVTGEKLSTKQIKIKRREEKKRKREGGINKEVFMAAVFWFPWA